MDLLKYQNNNKSYKSRWTTKLNTQTETSLKFTVQIYSNEVMTSLLTQIKKLFLKKGVLWNLLIFWTCLKAPYRIKPKCLCSIIKGTSKFGFHLSFSPPLLTCSCTIFPLLSYDSHTKPLILYPTHHFFLCLLCTIHIESVHLNFLPSRGKFLLIFHTANPP